jgi:hypothetical protein
MSSYSRKYLISGGSRKSLYELYKQSTHLVYLWNKNCPVWKFCLLFILKSLCAFNWSTKNKYSAEGSEPLIGYDGLFGVFLRKSKDDFYSASPRSRFSDKYILCIKNTLVKCKLYSTVHTTVHKGGLVFDFFPFSTSVPL